MSHVIVGVHGLANKPEKDKLAEWWRKSLDEGLVKNESFEGDYEFRMVYWADLLYRHALHDDKDFNFDRLYNGEPYVLAEPGALRPHRDNIVDDLRAMASEGVGHVLDIFKRIPKVDAVADFFLEKILKDLAFYYDESRKIRDRTGEQRVARQVLMDELAKELISLKGRQILLIAHSMGSIIAYDVLRNIGRSDPGFDISHFVTIGSPLGIPHVKRKVYSERDYSKVRLRTPTVVKKSWVNYADPKDPVAVDIHLADDYRQNAAGVRVRDDLVANDYKGLDGERNHHKSYGYLRTPELSEHVKGFLS